MLFSMSPDKAHGFIISAMAWAGTIAPIRSITKSIFAKKYPELQMKLGETSINSPVGLSAGLDKNGQVVPIISSLGFGFSEVGSVTAGVCAGNEKPWFHRLPQNKSLVVHAGLANQGVKQVLKNIKSNFKFYSADFPVIMSVARNNDPCVVTDKASIEDYVTSVKLAEKSPFIKMIEINISCPNAYGGEQFTRPSAFEELLKAIAKAKTTKPIIIKMPSDLDWEGFKKLINIALTFKIRIFAISNLAKDYSLIKNESLPEGVRGGLSGKPLQKLSDELIKKTYQTYGDKITIIGIGGIFTPEDAYRKIKLGASCVELITGMIYQGPQLPAQINQQLVEFLKKDGYDHISQAVGKDASK